MWNTLPTLRDQADAIAEIEFNQSAEDARTDERDEVRYDDRPTDPDWHEYFETGRF
jgi:hypothetical protein